jgi:hypothetical protein
MSARYIRILLILTTCFVTGYTSYAQDASRLYVEKDGWSIGMNVGMSDLWGDVGTKSAIEHYTNSKYFDKVAFMGGMFGRYSIHPCLAVRLGLNYGSLYATDKWNYDLAKKATSQGDDAYQRYARAQNARDYIEEGSILLEFQPFRMNPETKMANKRGQPFIGVGFAYFHYTPYSTVAASPTYVQTYDLHLEGQGFGAGFPPKYSLWQPAIPLVIGYRWDLGKHLNLGIEYMYRFTFTDYLDGVSGKYISAAAFNAHMAPSQATLAEQVADKGYWLNLEPPNAAGNLRGDPTNNDKYSTITITFYYKVHNHDRLWWK